VTVHITDADIDGAPVEAKCQVCHAWWVRPAGDPTAATLALFGLTHRHPPNREDDQR
jgi:hypothetical protein